MQYPAPMVNVRRAVKRGAGNILGKTLPDHSIRAIVEQAWKRDPEMVYNVIAPSLGRSMTIGTMPRDIEPDGPICFEHLAGLFSSTSFDHAVMPQMI